MPSELVTVGINGFGPVARNVFYAALQDPKLSVVAVNDPSFSAACMAYMMEREYPAHLHPLRVEAVSDKTVVVNGNHRIAVVQETRPTKWAELGVQVVLECTGTNTTRERCTSHVTHGAQQVVIAAHSADAPLVVSAVQAAESVGKDGRTVQVHSCGSRLGSVLAPLLRLLDEALSLEEVSYTAISGISDEADLAAGRSANPMDWRQLRLQQSTATGKGAFAPSAAYTGVATLLKLFPQLQGRLTASAFQVPGHKGCAIDLFVRTGRAVPKDELDRIILSAAAASGDGKHPFIGVVGGSGSSDADAAVVAGKGPMISTDCLGASTLLYEQGVSATASGGHSHKLMLWVDLEWAYAKQVVALASSFASVQRSSTSKGSVTESL